MKSVAFIIQKPVFTYNFCNKNVDIKFSVHDTFISGKFSRED
jgi:hypothetical protein